MALAHKFEEICCRYTYNPVIFPGEDNGIIYIAAKEVLWRPHNMKIFLENNEIMEKKTFRHSLLSIKFQTFPSLYI